MPRARKSARRKPPRLRPDGIVAAALRLVDRVGLEAFSMHRLGEELGVEAMSLYHHYPNRSALLDAVARRIMGEVSAAMPHKTGHLEDDLRALARSYSRSILRHGRAFPMLVMRPMNRLGASTFLEANASVLRSEGCPDGLARRLSLMITAFLNGMLLAEIAETENPGGAIAGVLDVDEESPRAAVAGLSVPSRSGKHWVAEIPAALEEGLELILERLRARLGPPSGARRNAD